MLTMIPHFATGATGLMAIFLLMSALGMLILVLVGLLYVATLNWAGTSRMMDFGLAAFAFVIGKLWMTSMLPMVALSNGIGGGAAGAFAAVELFADKAAGSDLRAVTLIGALIGAASLSGSLIAWARLKGIIGKPSRTRGRQALGLAAIATALVVGGGLIILTAGIFTAGGGADRLIAAPGWISLLLGCALLAGALMTFPVGTARMPGMISIYNGLTGIAIGLEGFALRSPTLIIAGMVVGAARMVCTLPMARG